MDIGIRLQISGYGRDISLVRNMNEISMMIDSIEKYDDDHIARWLPKLAFVVSCRGLEHLAVHLYGVVNIKEQVAYLIGRYNRYEILTLLKDVAPVVLSCASRETISHLKLIGYDHKWILSGLLAYGRIDMFEEEYKEYESNHSNMIYYITDLPTQRGTGNRIDDRVIPQHIYRNAHAVVEYILQRGICLYNSDCGIDSSLYGHVYIPSIFMHHILEHNIVSVEKICYSIRANDNNTDGFNRKMLLFLIRNGRYDDARWLYNGMGRIYNHIPDFMLMLYYDGNVENILAAEKIFNLDPLLYGAGTTPLISRLFMNNRKESIEIVKWAYNRGIYMTNYDLSPIVHYSASIPTISQEQREILQYCISREPSLRQYLLRRIIYHNEPSSLLEMYDKDEIMSAIVEYCEQFNKALPHME